MKPAIAASGALAALSLGACSMMGPPSTGDNVFSITSSAFKDGAMLEKKNAGNNPKNPNCIGENVSPPLTFSNPPTGTKSYALLMVDPEGRGGLGVNHWVAYGIPVSVTGFAENEVSQLNDKYVGGKSTQGLGYYFGPCTPPATGMHHYTFTLIATDLEAKELPAGLTREELLPKLQGHSKGAAGLVGLFGRKP
ncbi:MAG TPA: YbhB/YbcL family Raf kinase inhibitor-like protein [Burkholderiales bacterium]|nr:YbhB/YbcL family Raf kinase inhibitor-like protein [Burkholderiales bacterium]